MSEVPMQTAKQDAVAMIAALPDDVSIEEIQYRLYVLEHIRAGMAELDAGEGIPHDEVRAEFAKWLDD
jgi:predicted transcriptional regulator